MERTIEREYLMPDGVCSISSGALGRVDEPTQIEVMRIWFLQNYEIPAENTPYDSEEGGYIYIWGGPFDAKEELETEFADTVPSSVINKLVSELSAQSEVWSGKPGGGDILEYLVKDILDIEFFNSFQDSVHDIIELTKSKIDPSVKSIFNRLLYANIITALESYLSGAFITTVLDNPDLMRRFVETTPDFQKAKIPVSAIYEQMEKLREKISNYLSNIIWHDLDRVKQMYKDTLGIDFPKDLKEIFKAILVRHDIVHRNGKTKKGGEHVISLDSIGKLLESIRALVAYINTQLAIIKLDASRGLSTTNPT